jgi:elongation factor G
MGELHLEIIKQQARPRHEDQRRVGKPKRLVPRGHRRKAKNVRGLFKKQSGGRGQFGDCTITLEPFTKEQAEAEELDFTDNIAFENKIVGGSIPKEFIPSIEYGIRQTALTGVTVRLPLDQRQGDAGRRLVPRRRLVQVAFEQAGRLALLDAVEKAGWSCSSRS